MKEKKEEKLMIIIIPRVQLCLYTENEYGC